MNIQPCNQNQQPSFGMIHCKAGQDLSSLDRKLGRGGISHIPNLSRYSLIPHTDDLDKFLESYSDYYLTGEEVDKVTTAKTAQEVKEMIVGFAANLSTITKESVNNVAKMFDIETAENHVERLKVKALEFLGIKE